MSKRFYIVHRRMNTAPNTPNIRPKRLYIMSRPPNTVSGSSNTAPNCDDIVPKSWNITTKDDEVVSKSCQPSLAMENYFR